MLCDICGFILTPEQKLNGETHCDRKTSHVTCPMVRDYTFVHTVTGYRVTVEATSKHEAWHDFRNSKAWSEGLGKHGHMYYWFLASAKKKEL